MKKNTFCGHFTSLCRPFLHSMGFLLSLQDIRERCLIQPFIFFRSEHPAFLLHCGHALGTDLRHLEYHLNGMVSTESQTVILSTPHSWHFFPSVTSTWWASQLSSTPWLIPRCDWEPPGRCSFPVFPEQDQCRKLQLPFFFENAAGRRLVFLPVKQ